MKIPCWLLPALFLVAAVAAPLAAEDAKAPEDTVNVAILIFEYVQIIDFTGPYEVFGQAGFNVYTVAASAAPITTSMGMKVTPSYTLANAPAPDVIVVPGGDIRSASGSAEVLAWLSERAKPARHVLTVCNGAFILAKTGLLDGLTATTFYDLIPKLKETAPKVHVVSDRRYVDNGQIITTAGLSSGIDGALHVVERMLGHGQAQKVALNMEYDWRPDSGFARAALADAELRRIFGRPLELPVPAGGSAQVVSTEGTASHWEARWSVKTSASLSDLQTLLVRQLTETGKWTPKPPLGEGLPREWTYKDADQRTWSSRVELAPEAGKDGEYRLAIKVERAGS